MKTFFPNIAFLVSALEGEDAWDADQQTDAFDQVLDGLLWWRRWVKAGFGFPLIYAPSCPRIATVDGNDGVKAVLDPLFRPPFTIFLGHRHKQPYGLAWNGNSIYITYNFKRQEIVIRSAHEWFHIFGGHNRMSNDIANEVLALDEISKQEIRAAGIVELR